MLQGFQGGASCETLTSFLRVDRLVEVVVNEAEVVTQWPFALLSHVVYVDVI